MILKIARYITVVTPSSSVTSDGGFISGKSDRDKQLWNDCIHSVTKVMEASHLRSSSTANSVAKNKALSFLRQSRKLGMHPPVMIDQEPAGGIIVTFEEEDTSDEWTFYNSGEVEFTKYVDNKVVVLQNAGLGKDGCPNISKYSSNWIEPISSASYSMRPVVRRKTESPDLVASW